MGILQQITAADFTPLERWFDPKLAEPLLNQARFMLSAEGGQKAADRAMATANAQGAAAYDGLASRLIGMGVDPSSARFQAAMQQTGLQAAKAGIGTINNALDNNRMMGLQAMQHGLNLSSGLANAAAKIKGDIWAMQNQQEDIGKRYEVGMANANASMASANAAAARAAAESAYNMGRLGIERMDAENRWRKTSYEIDDPNYWYQAGGANGSAAAAGARLGIELAKRVTSGGGGSNDSSGWSSNSGTPWL